jgi:chromosome segregation ATPase
MGQEGSKEGNSENMATGPLNSEQLNQLPIPIKDILLQYFNDQASYQAELKSKFDRLCVDSEQKCFSLEQQHRSDQEKLETESKISSDLHQQVADLEKRYNEISEKYREIQSTFFEKEKFWNFEEQKLLRSKAILESEKADLSELLNQRNYDVDRLTAEWKQMSEKLNETTKLRLASQASADQASSELVIIQNRESRMVRELEQVRQQNDLLNQELQARFNEIMNIRKDKSTQLIDLQSQLDDVISQANHSTQSLEQSKKIQSEQAEQIETYITKLREAKDAHIQMEEQYRSELSAQEKLINLYKVSAEEAESKMCEMMKAVEELQKLLSQATEGSYDRILHL